MANNSNSQNSYLILDSLSNGSKYGLEIIEFISQKTGGNIIMKKPSLYSSLTRMEKKGLISSSYWGESDIGGKRHYYSITTAGRKTLEELAEEFKYVDFGSTADTTLSSQNISVNTTKASDDARLLEPEEKLEESEQHSEKPMFLQQNNIFDLVKETPAKAEEKVSVQNSDVIENQMDIFSLPPQNVVDEKPESNEDDLKKIEYYESILKSTPTKEEQPKDDGKFLESNEHLTFYQTEQNKRLYDTSSELKKYRKKKSFSENQIEMAVIYEKAEDREIQKERIESLKKSMLTARENAYNVVENKQLTSLPETSTTSVTNPALPVQPAASETSDKDSVLDDAVFITEPRIDHSQIPVQKKISPTNIEVNIFDSDLPAPKRDSNLEPTYKDMMAKLFERKKEKEKLKEETDVQTTTVQEVPSTVTTFADYDSLKKYYAQHNIEFKEHKKASIKRHHNTNFLNLITSCFLLVLSGIGCGVLFAIANTSNNISKTTSFMYYTLPILFLIYTIYSLIKYKVCSSKKPMLSYNSIVNWAVCILAVVIVFVINIICGMQYETIPQYQTSLFVPILGILLAFPINYYIKLLFYKKYGK